MKYKKLLTKYMALVASKEYSTYIVSKPDFITDREWYILQDVSKTVEDNFGDIINVKDT
jgi:hypothetical protein